MFIRNLDFLSSPPQMYILQQKTNKTLFGGILFIIYIIIMLNISLIFILNYALNDKYNVRYSFYNDFSNNEEYNKNEDLDPKLNFSLNIKKVTKDYDLIDTDEFFIVDDDFNFLDTNSPISSTISNMSFFIMKFCFLECSDEIDNDTNIAYYVNISYSGYKIDHQNKNIPLETNNDKYTFYRQLYFQLSKTTFHYVNWNLIKYKEERGLYRLFDNLLDKKYEFTAIDIDQIDQTIFEKAIDIGDPEVSFLKIRMLAFIEMINPYNQYEEYIRNKKSFLDVLADICALFSTLFSVFTFIFNFYSKNFDNYKIIKETLSIPKFFQTTNKKIFKSNSITFEGISFNKKDSIDTNDITSFDSFKITPNNLKRMNMSQREEINLKENNNKKSIGIKCIYFILDNIYCKNNKMKKEFNIINICNNILSKYSSIETILYNQIMFENLLKDYHWNNNNLEIVENNYLIKKLKSRIT